MSDLLWVIISCAFLGCFVGFFAGLLGIGGGLLIVPVFSVILIKFQLVGIEHVMVVAISTSLASIIFTSSSSAVAHHRNHNVPWEIAPWIMFGVALGALTGGFFAGSIDPKVLKIIFGFSVAFIAIRMLLSTPASNNKKLPSNSFLLLITAVLGGLSGLIGIGGGALLVPLLTYFSIDMKKAIGCAAVCGIVIAIFGTVGYVSSGVGVMDIKQGFMGYVYLPALLSIVATSMIFAQFGAKATHYLPVKFIKKVFAILLIIIAIKMLFA